MTQIDKTKPLLVTGATGYVASWLVKKLLEEGITVHAAKFIKRNIDVGFRADNSKIKKELDIAFRPMKESMEEAFQALVDNHIFQKK